MYLPSSIYFQKLSIGNLAQKLLTFLKFQWIVGGGGERNKTFGGHISPEFLETSETFQRKFGSNSWVIFWISRDLLEYFHGTFGQKLLVNYSSTSSRKLVRNVSIHLWNSGELANKKFWELFIGNSILPNIRNSINNLPKKSMSAMTQVLPVVVWGHVIEDGIVWKRVVPNLHVRHLTVHSRHGDHRLTWPHILHTHTHKFLQDFCSLVYISQIRIDLVQPSTKWYLAHQVPVGERFTKVWIKLEPHFTSVHLSEEYTDMSKRFVFFSHKDLSFVRH